MPPDAEVGIEMKPVNQRLHQLLLNRQLRLLLLHPALDLCRIYLDYAQQHLCRKPSRLVFRREIRKDPVNEPKQLEKRLALEKYHLSRIVGLRQRNKLFEELDHLEPHLPVFRGEKRGELGVVLWVGVERVEDLRKV